MPFATTPDGTCLYFETHGTGTPLLLLAGQASDHREWDACAPTLLPTTA